MNAVVRPATPPAASTALSGPAFVGRLLRTILVACVLFLAGNYAINFVLTQFSHEPVREHLREAFTAGKLGLMDSRKLDSGMGVHQVNDCLIYDMAARDAGSNWMHYLVAAQHTDELSDNPPDQCEQLRNWVLNDPTVTSREYWYQRYIHGYRAVAVALLSVLGVADARMVMKLASYGVFLALCLLNLRALLARRSSRGNTGWLAGNELAYIGIGLSFMLFFGLPYFGQSISHAPAIVTLGLFLIFWSRRDLRRELDLARMTRLVVVYALFTAAFDFLTGYIPIGVALLCLLVAISDRATRFDNPRALLYRVVTVEFAFIATILAVMSLHLLATAMFGPAEDTLRSILAKLAVSAGRAMSGPTHATGIVTVLGISDVVTRFLEQLPHIGIPGLLTGLVTLLVAFGVILVGFGETWLGATSRDARWRATLIAAALLPLVLWMLMFVNHSYTHARFMVRILVAVYLTAAVMLFWWRANRGTVSEATAPMAATTRRLAPP